MNERSSRSSTVRGLTSLATTDFWTISTDPTWRGEDRVGFWARATDGNGKAGTENPPAAGARTPRENERYGASLGSCDG